MATGLLIGALYGRPLVGALIAVVGLLLWHLYNLWLLERWLQTGDLEEMPAGNGAWARVFARAQFLDAQNRLNRKKYRRLVKELRTSMKAFPDGGIILSPNNEIIAVNKAARILLGLKRKRDRGQRIDNFIRHPSFVAFLDAGGRKKTVEIPAPHGDKWLSCRLMPYGPDQRLLLVTDVTRARKLETMRRDFVANASHELRSPLTVIAGYLDALDDAGDLPDTWSRPVADMREQTRRMSQLVGDLLQLSKLESSAPGPLDAAVDIVAMLRAARQEALAQPVHPHRIELDIRSDARLLGEESEIRSVVVNLVSNAVRYTPEDGCIEIGWSVDEDGGHLSVADTGIGVAPDDVPRLTERFFRSDGGRARQQGGTGLGLAIVKYALRRHDAKLEIESEPGRGSRFTCRFAPHRIDSRTEQTKDPNRAVPREELK